ncbi:MAG: histidinol-phosphatase [Planctomycetaceae bacterium]
MIEPAALASRLEFALDAAREAGELILGYYQAGDLAVDHKHDLSPVTAADRGAEELLRARIDEHFPEDGVLGEEFAAKPSSNGVRWILDPLDGTKAFVSGVPLFGTLIALEIEKELALGVCRLPVLDEVIYATQGTGTWWQTAETEPRRVRVSSTTRMEDALVCFTDLEGWLEAGRFHTLQKIAKAARVCRGWGDCYGHVLVATGRADVMLDPLVSVWDAAALVPILQEAGGHYADWKGEATIYSGHGFSSNAALRTTVLEKLKC